MFRKMDPAHSLQDSRLLGSFKNKLDWWLYQWTIKNNPHPQIINMLPTPNITNKLLSNLSDNSINKIQTIKPATTIPKKYHRSL